jgi:hypothetical protein
VQAGLIQQSFGLPSGLQPGLQPGLQFCSVHCLDFFTFLGLLLSAKAPVANEHTIASISIFFILINFEMKE